MLEFYCYAFASLFSFLAILGSIEKRYYRILNFYRKAYYWRKILNRTDEMKDLELQKLQDENNANYRWLQKLNGKEVEKESEMDTIEIARKRVLASSSIPNFRTTKIPPKKLNKEELKGYFRKQFNDFEETASRNRDEQDFRMQVDGDYFYYSPYSENPDIPDIVEETLESVVMKILKLKEDELI